MPFPELEERVREIRGRVSDAVSRGGHGQTVRIVAVTKTYGHDAVKAAWEAGLPDVGENRIQEALEKIPSVTVPVAWHLIGHLQRNKVKHLELFSMMHSLDSLRLAEAVNTDGLKSAKPHAVLLQVNTSGEESKGGFSEAEVDGALERLRAMRGLELRGVMTMAPLDADEATLRSTFGRARAIGDRLAASGFPATERSMGMSGDFEIAVEEGATMVRLGTILFGARPI
jgi:pyridoxal phosphate enzyme (YggS family)